MPATEPGLVSIVRKVDGRRLRSKRTRQAVIDAYLRLLRRNPTMPKAAQIAKEAGYSVRSVFERFTDLDELTLATADYAIVQGQAEAVARNVDADRATRVRSHVETRALACEKWLPLWRVMVKPGPGRPQTASCDGASRQHRANEADVPSRIVHAHGAGLREPPIGVGYVDQL